MKALTLTPRTAKAKNSIREAAAILSGWDKKTWMVMKRAKQVSFSDIPGPWLLVSPMTAMGGNQAQLSRWVNRFVDDHFAVAEDVTADLGPNVKWTN